MPSLSIKPGAVIGGRYRIERPLGSGAMGEVYLATHQQLGSKVAVKFLDPRAAGNHPETLERFKREGRAAVAIKHPGIVSMLDLGATPEGARYLVMEYLEGQTLHAFMERVGAVRAPVAAAVLAPMLDALEAAHGAGVVHRDLKPANVMLTTGKPPMVKLLDFGISKVASAAKLTSVGVAMGTPEYMSPEQCTDATQATPASDLYAVGVIAYELLSGRLPIHGPTVHETLYKVLREPPPKLATVVGEVPPRLCELVDALLTKDPKARPQTAAGVRAALLAAIKPDPKALWAAVEAPDEIGSAPTFARPSPATPLQLAELAPKVTGAPAPPKPGTSPGVPSGPPSTSGARVLAIRPADDRAPVLQLSTQVELSKEAPRSLPPAPQRSSALPVVLGLGAVGLLAAGGFWLLGGEEPAGKAPIAATSDAPAAQKPEPEKEPARPPEKPAVAAEKPAVAPADKPAAAPVVAANNPAVAAAPSPAPALAAKTGAVVEKPAAAPEPGAKPAPPRPDVKSLFAGFTKPAADEPPTAEKPAAPAPAPAPAQVAAPPPAPAPDPAAEAAPPAEKVEKTEKPEAPPAEEKPAPRKADGPGARLLREAKAASSADNRDEAIEKLTECTRVDADYAECWCALSTELALAGGREAEGLRASQSCKRLKGETQ